MSPASTVPGASIRPAVGMSRASGPRFEDRRLAGPVRLARPEGHRAALGHEQRIEHVDEIRVGRGVVRGSEVMDPDAEAVERSDEPVVLAPGSIEVDRAEEAVGRIVEGPPEGGAGPLDEDVAQGGRRAARAVAALGRHHRPRIRRRLPFPIAVPRGIVRRVSGYVASARIARASPRLARTGAAADLASPVVGRARERDASSSGPGPSRRTAGRPWPIAGAPSASAGPS